MHLIMIGNTIVILPIASDTIVFFGTAVTRRIYPLTFTFQAEIRQDFDAGETRCWFDVAKLWQQYSHTCVFDSRIDTKGIRTSDMVCTSEVHFYI